MAKLFLLCFICLLSVYTVLSSPFSYKRHQNFYHHLPYHVNYSPYNYPRRSYYREPVYNDFDDHSSNEPVKGGIKNSHRNQIKTPMKVILERKNGYLSNIKANQYQENIYETKYTNPSSTKQTSNFINPVIYPNENEADKNDNFDQFTKKIENSSKKNRKTKPSFENKNSVKDNSQKSIPANNSQTDVKTEKFSEKKKDEENSKNVFKDNSEENEKSNEKEVKKEINKETTDKIVDPKKSEKVETTTVQSSSTINDQSDIKNTVTKKTEQNSNLETIVPDNVNKNEEKKVDSNSTSFITTVNPVDTNKIVKSDLPDTKKMNNEVENVNDISSESIKNDKIELNTNAPLIEEKNVKNEKVAEEKSVKDEKVVEEKSVKDEKVVEEIKLNIENLDSKNLKANNSLVDIPPPTNFNSETETTTSNFFLVN